MANQIAMDSYPIRDFVLIFILLSMTVGGLAFLTGCRKGDSEVASELSIDQGNRIISFSGTVHPQRYNRYQDRQCGHHFIVWSGGGNANKALINTDIPDEQILIALESIGALPGNNLSEETWTERDNPSSLEPDKRVQGTPVDVFVSWNDEEHPAHSLFQTIQPNELNIHVGGHRDLIPVWRSGCVTCLFSCPGGRTSNAAYTIRDQAQNRKIFLADESILPPDGTKVTVKMEVRE